jgi:hypothetical protein
MNRTVPFTIRVTPQEREWIHEKAETEQYRYDSGWARKQLGLDGESPYEEVMALLAEVQASNALLKQQLEELRKG